MTILFLQNLARKSRFQNAVSFFSLVLALQFQSLISVANDQIDCRIDKAAQEGPGGSDLLLAQQKFLAGDYKSALQMMRQSLMAAQKGNAVEAGNFKLLDCLYRVGAGALAVDFSLPQTISDLSIGFRKMYREPVEDHRFSVVVRSTNPLKRALRQLKVSRLPSNKVLLDLAVKSTHWEDDNTAFADVPPSQLQSGLYRVELTTQQGETMDTWFIVSDGLPSADPVLSSPQADETLSVQRPRFEFQDFRSSELKPYESREMHAQLNFHPEVGHPTGETFSQMFQNPSLTSIVPQNILPDGEYRFHVDYSEVKNFGPLRIVRGAMTVVPFFVNTRHFPCAHRSFADGEPGKAEIQKAETLFCDQHFREVPLALKDVFSVARSEGPIATRAFELYKGTLERIISNHFVVDYEIPAELSHVTVSFQKIHRTVVDNDRYTVSFQGHASATNPVRSLELMKGNDVLMDTSRGKGRLSSGATPWFNRMASFPAGRQQFAFVTDQQKASSGDGLYKYVLTLRDGTTLRGWFIATGTAPSTRPSFLVPAKNCETLSQNPQFQFPDYRTADYDGELDKRFLEMAVNHWLQEDFPARVWNAVIPEPSIKSKVVDVPLPLENNCDNMVVWINFVETRHFGPLHVARENGASTHFLVH